MLPGDDTFALPLLLFCRPERLPHSESISLVKDGLKMIKVIAWATDGSPSARRALSVAKDLVISGQWPSPVNLGFHIFLAAICVTAMVARSRRYQEIAGIAGAAAVVTYIGLLFMQLR